MIVYKMYIYKKVKFKDLKQGDLYQYFIFPNEIFIADWTPFIFNDHKNNVKEYNYYKACELKEYIKLILS